jgi:hypothetical protein
MSAGIASRVSTAPCANLHVARADLHGGLDRARVVR